MEKTKTDYLLALARSKDSVEDYKEVENLIEKYFSMMEHMKRTSLYNVYKYEENLTKAITHPMEILKYENESLKKEVNKLRKQLGKIEKYKEGI